PVRGAALAAVEDLDERRHRAQLDDLADERVRHAVEPVVERDVVVDADLDLARAPEGRREVPRVTTIRAVVAPTGSCQAVLRRAPRLNEVPSPAINFVAVPRPRVVEPVPTSCGSGARVLRNRRPSAWNQRPSPFGTAARVRLESPPACVWNTHP